MKVASAAGGTQRVRSSWSRPSHDYQWAVHGGGKDSASQPSWLSPSQMWGMVPVVRADSDDESGDRDDPGSSNGVGVGVFQDSAAVARVGDDTDARDGREDSELVTESAMLLSGGAGPQQSEGWSGRRTRSKSPSAEARRTRMLGHAVGPKARSYHAGESYFPTGLEILTDSIRRSTATIWWQRETLTLAIAAGLLTSVRVRAWPFKYVDSRRGENGGGPASDVPGGGEALESASGPAAAGGRAADEKRETEDDDNDDEDWGVGDKDEDEEEVGWVQSCLASVNPFVVCQVAPAPRPRRPWGRTGTGAQRSFNTARHGRVIAARWAPPLLVSKDAVLLGRARRRSAEEEGQAAAAARAGAEASGRGGEVGTAAQDAAAETPSNSSTGASLSAEVGGHRRRDGADGTDEADAVTEATGLVSRGASRRTSGEEDGGESGRVSGGGVCRDASGATVAATTKEGSAAVERFSPSLLGLTVFLTDAVMPVLVANVLLASGVRALLAAGTAQGADSCPRGGLALAIWGTVFGGFLLLWGLVRAGWLAGTAAGGRFKPLQWLAAASLVVHAIRAAMAAWGCLALVGALTAVLGRPPSTADLAVAAEMASTNKAIAACGGAWTFGLLGTAAILAGIVHGIAITNAVFEAATGADVTTAVETRFALDCLQQGLEGKSLETAGPFGASLQAHVPQSTRGVRSRASGDEASQKVD